jgi:hypothetical protein
MKRTHAQTKAFEAVENTILGILSNILKDVVPEKQPHKKRKVPKGEGQR